MTYKPQKSQCPYDFFVGSSGHGAYAYSLPKLPTLY